MYELIQVGKRTYYINCPAKIGIYLINEQEVCLIDSGNDKEAGKKVLKILQANQWTLSIIINTHSHADHIGGNHLLQQRTNCKIYTVGIEASFTKFPILEPSYLFGGYPCKELRNKFLYAQDSEVEELTEEILPEGLEMMRIDGHTFEMVAIKTEDDVWFMADAFTSEAIIDKYHVSYLYDVKEYKNTLEKLKCLKGSCFIPSHAEPTDNIIPLIEINLRKVEELISQLTEICKVPMVFDDILQKIFDKYGLKMDFGQHVLVGSTIRSYLSYMHEENILDVAFVNNKLYWKIRG